MFRATFIFEIGVFAPSRQRHDGKGWEPAYFDAPSIPAAACEAKRRHSNGEWGGYGRPTHIVISDDTDEHRFNWSEVEMASG